MILGRANLVVLLAVAAIVLPYNYLKRVSNFAQVDAVVESVSHECQRDGTTLGSFKLADPKSIRACSTEELESEQSPFPALIARKIVVQYISPVDQQEHRGSVRYVGFLHNLQKLPTRGSIAVLASRSDADRLEAIEQ